jgi:elongation factor Ts
LPLNGATVEEVRKTLVGKIGENVSLRRFARLAATGKLATYIHGGAKVGVMIDVAGGDDALAKDIAMHIAAIKPVALSKAEIPSDLIKRERDIAAAKAAESGKPANIVEKMVEGSVAKFLKEVTLLGQPFVKDDKQTVEQLLKRENATVHAFKLFVVGEGLEKRKDDFVAEVLAQAKQADRAAQPS